MPLGAAQEQLSPKPPAAEGLEDRVPGLAQLYAEHGRYVWRCLRSLGVFDRELDDAIQDLFLVVQRRLPEFDGRVAARTWLYAIAIRIARRYRERNQRARRHDEFQERHTEQFAVAQDAEADIERNAKLALAHQALDALDDGKREVFVLSQVEQMSASEIAAITGLPVNTVYSRLRAARTAFAAEVKRLQARARRSP